MRSDEGVQSPIAVQYQGGATVVVNAFANLKCPMHLARYFVTNAYHDPRLCALCQRGIQPSDE